MFCCLKAQVNEFDTISVSHGTVLEKSATSEKATPALLRRDSTVVLTRGSSTLRSELVAASSGAKVEDRCVVAKGSDLGPEKFIWSGLVEGVKQHGAKAYGVNVEGAKEANDMSVLRLTPGGGLVPIQELIRLCDSCGDPVAILTLERTTRRAMRTQRVSPSLLVDINLEALFAGGLGIGGESFTAGHAGGVPFGSGAIDDLDPASGMPVQTLVQSTYYKAEALRLSVQHSNAPLHALLGCPGAAEYEALLADLVGSEPHLRAVLHDCCLGMLDGVPAPATQLMVNHPIPGTHARVVLPVVLQPVLIRSRPQAPMAQPGMAAATAAVAAAAAGGAVAAAAAAAAASGTAGVALVVRYNLTAGLRSTLQQLHRVYTMLLGLPGIVTLFTLRGRVLHQNTASIRYMGLRQESCLYDAINSTHPDHQRDARGLSVGSILSQMFSLAGEQLDEMLEEAAMGKTWKGIVRVPPLLSPIVDPGPAAPAAALARGSTYVSTTSQAQILSTWERLGTVMMSTQPGNLVNASNADRRPSDTEVRDLAKALLTTAEERSALAPRAPDVARGRGALQDQSSTSGMARRNTTGLNGSASTVDSNVLLAGASNSGNSFSRLKHTNLGMAQDSNSRSRFRAEAAAASEHDCHDVSSTSANLCAANMSAVGQERSLAAPKPLVAAAATVIRANSITRISSNHLVSTLMENGSAMMRELDKASGTIGAIGGGGGSVGDPRQPRLTDAAKRSIVRRRSALKLTSGDAADADPLSTSTWGLLDGARIRPESKSFSVRRPPSALSMGQHITRHGTDLSCDGPIAEPTVAPGSLPSSSSVVGSTNSKRRAPSRLMSFLASRNINGTLSAGPSRTGMPNAGNLSSSPAADGDAPAQVGALRKTVSSSLNTLSRGEAPGQASCLSTTALEELPQPRALQTPPMLPSPLVAPSASTPSGGGSPSAAATPAVQPPPAAATAEPAPAPAPSAAAVEPAPTRVRRPPGRRVVRPTVEDVAEESGAEQSNRLVAAVSRSQQPGFGRQDPALLPGVLMGSRAGVSHSQLSAFGSNAGATNSQLAFAALRGITGGTSSQVPDMGVPASLNPSQAPAAAAVAGAHASNTSGTGHEDDEECWHEVTAVTLKDPVLGEQVLMIMQVDVSARVKAERHIAEVLEAEHKLLESVFPRHVLEAAAGQATRNASAHERGRAKEYSLAAGLAQHCSSVATYHPVVTILFADIIGFTSMCHEIPATKVMEFLNNLYQRLDTLLDVYGVYKVETIGDCYMVAGGLMTRDADGFMTVRGSDSLDELHAAKVMSFAKAMLRETAEVMLPTTGRPVQMRIGLHSGPVMSGIVGSKMPRFCLFGDTVNTASRMESTCPPGCIHVSASTRDCLPAEEWEPTGGVQVKGKGMMETYRWVPPDADHASGPTHSGPGRRTRRASFVSYLQGGGGPSSRDQSGSMGVLSPALPAQQPAAAAPSAPPPGAAVEGPFTTAAAPKIKAESASIIKDAAAALKDSSVGKSSRVASAVMGFMLDGASGSLTDKNSASGRMAMQASAANGGSGPTKKVRRKPHRSCSTTAVAYMGMGRAVPL